MSSSQHKILKIFKILGKTLLGILIFLILILLFIRSEWGQNLIKDKLISSIEEKSGASVRLDRIFIQFNGDIEAEDLYIESPQGDTIIYSEHIVANIGLLNLIKSRSFDLNSLESRNLKAKIFRKDTIEGFNYEVLLKAFASDTTTQPSTVPDTTGAMPVHLGSFDLENIDFTYNDGVSGIDSRFRFKDLKAEFTESDIEGMTYKLGPVRLSDAIISIRQFEVEQDTTSEDTPLPLITLETADFKDVKFAFENTADSLVNRIDATELVLENAVFDMREMNIRSEHFKMHNSVFYLSMITPENLPEVQSSTEAFEWPEWNIDINNIDLRNNTISYFVDGTKVENGSFNPNALHFENFDLQAETFSYQPKDIFTEIQELRFNEGSGMEVTKFNIQARINNTIMEFRDLDIAANANTASGNIVVRYENIDDFFKQPGNANIDANLQNILVQVNDIFRFQPELRKNEYVQSLTGNPVIGNLQVDGTIDNLRINSFTVGWRNTRISGSGSVGNVQQPENVYYTLPNVSAATTRTDLLNFINEEDLGIKLPKSMKLKGNFSGNANRLKTTSKLLTTEGNIDITGNFDFNERIAFDTELTADSLALGQLLQNAKLGDISMTLSAKGSGSGMNDLDAEMESTISDFQFNGYDFKNIQLSANLEKGRGPVTIFYQDSNLDIEAQTILKLDTISPRYDFTVYLDGADLGALGITQKTIKAGFVLDGWFQGNASEYEAGVEIVDGVAVYNNKTYLLGSFDASAFVRPDTTSIVVDNRVFDINLQSNADPLAFTKAIDRHFKRYITENYKEDSIAKPVNLRLDAKIAQAPILNEVFLVNLEELDSVAIAIDFREKDRQFDASVSLPFINYYSSKIDSLRFELKSDPTDLDFELAFRELNAGPLAIKRTALSGKVLDRKLALGFNSSYAGDTLVNVDSELNFQGDTLKYHIHRKNLVLNQNPWDIEPTNLISYKPGYLDFRDFVLFREEQRMTLSNNKPGIEKEHLSLDFQNFRLSALLNYLNPEEQLAKGMLNGGLVYEDPFGKTGLLADLQINNFEILGVNLNTLSLEGNSSGFSNYQFDMAIKGGEVDLDLEGSYIADEVSANLDMNLDLNEVKMTALEGFSFGEIKDGSGSFSGNFKLNGTVLEPQYTGSLNFNNAGFNIAMLNAPFILPDETLSLDNNGLYFENFQIEDGSNNSFVINGNVGTKTFLNPTFDLDLKARDFKLLNSTEEDNDLFYGEAIVDADAKISGDLNLPVVNMDVTIKEATNFTYVVPEAELQMKERDGIVIFVNKENPEDILTQQEEESYVISGYDIFSRIRVADEATFNVIINKDTGDIFSVQGEGDLIFNMYPNGRIALTGIYEIKDGYYEMSLYNLVKRRFEIADGSRVSWAGDPFEAQLDVRAIYSVETSASSLMAAQTSAVDPGSMSRFRQKLPFFVYLNIDGDLMEPKITFNLDMPEDEQGAIGGQVYGVVQNLNNQEQELNKQVFSLLVLNRFFPGGGSDGSSGGTLAVARDNLNDALSDQLNMLSSRILGQSGLQLNFQVDSFTDYQGESPEDRTQLDISAQKAFLEDRLVVEVGSELDIQGGNQPGQETSPVIGNVSVSYLLDEDGIWRLKGFSRSQYENVVDGQLIVSGIALIFTKEFNKFKNLFAKAIREEVEQQPEKDSEENNNINEE